jgi:YidC/Oxa1 family membrane protein insertase
MQDQGKRMLLAVAIALGVMLIWTQFIASPTPPATTTPTANGSAQTIVLSGKPALETEKPCVGSTVETFTFPHILAEMTSCGGTLIGWKLTDKRYETDTTGGQLVRKALTPMSANEVGDFALDFVDPKGMSVVPDGVQWVGKRISDTQMQYTLDAGGNHLVKTFTFYPDANMVSMSYEGSTAGKGQLVPTVSVFGWQDPKTDTSSSARVQPRVWESTTYRDGDYLATADMDIGGSDGQARFEKDVQWTGFEHPYLMTVFAPHLPPDEVTKHTHADSAGGMRTDIELKGVTAGTVQPHEIFGYLGPKEYERLDGADGVAKFDTGFKETQDWGRLPLINVSLSIIGKPLLWLLGKLFLIIGNWGVSIILLTIVVKVITAYWTTKSMRSMKAMAAVSPQVQEIQKRHGGDKQRAQMETMALYKTHGIRPLAGCAPMFLQIPIWSALYRMLSAAGELYLQPFIPGWINDLTNTDPYYILPVALCGMMFLQARLTPQNAAQPGQKMMQYGMPLVFGFFSFYFPAGLTLYILTNTMLSSIHSIYMNRYDKKSLALVALLKKNKAAAEARAKADEESASVAKAKGVEGKRKKPALKVVDTTAVEPATAVEPESAKSITSEGDAVDPDDNDESDASGAAVGGGNQERRSKRKKRRR